MQVFEPSGDNKLDGPPLFSPQDTASIVPKIKTTEQFHILPLIILDWVQRSCWHFWVMFTYGFFSACWQMGSSKSLQFYVEENFSELVPQFLDTICRTL